MVTLLFAAADEYHQSFVNGRAGQLTDILIDGGGAVIGILIAVGCMALFRHIRNKRFARVKEPA